MEIKKVNLDRSKPSSSYIEQKQDFNKVLSNVKMTKTPTWKSPWFYGAVGLSSVAITAISLSSFSNENYLNEKKATLEKDKIQIAAVISIPAQKTEVLSVTNHSEEKTVVSEKEKVNSVVAKDKTPEKSVSVNEIVVVENPVVKKQIHSGLPSINGISNGVMSAKKLQDSEKIESNSDFVIASYKVQYYNGDEDVVVQVNGNKIPSEVIAQIIDYNVGQMIFFTDIKGVNDQGKLTMLPSMNFKLTN